MQIPILNGIYASASEPDIRVSYPVNLMPVPSQSGISSSFLRPCDGIVQNGTGPGIDRGGINWNGECYRVMGTKLVKVSAVGAITILGDVGGSNLVTLDYSFDRLAIASNKKLYYWNGTTLTQVTDADLGDVLDVIFIDGYFMTTDGENIVVTELNDPTSVNPLKYGSSEVDPDPVVAVMRLRNEVYVVNRNTIEVFDNVGGDFFPFQRIDGAQIQKGAIGTNSCCVFLEALAFVGSGRNEEIGVYLGVNANATKISTQEIDLLLSTYSDSELTELHIETRNDKGHLHLYIHLPDRTIVYDAAASQALNEPVWFVLTSSLLGYQKYRARNFVWVYNKWLVGDPTSSKIGCYTRDSSHHWGDIVRWEFGTAIMYNEGSGAIFNSLELISLTGRVALGLDVPISTQYSVDGVSWSQVKSINTGTIGGMAKRLVWFKQGQMRHWRIQRFLGDSRANLSFVRLEAQLEPLAY
ncbi:Bacteriophage P22, Gp10, DNA-stabilising [uncultured Caudovirales phage]|uniref:Bacteriophage P22, Gp10, DNA-stabilising n=1 Tax=uncultured Caudovirales phage TaxID=2100421 RepID=A0A6J5PCM6_9CAUD|nr:Bacteriophage P22, Gp10, DNA-stabilising [uncultured Caudovirales phage]